MIFLKYFRAQFDYEKAPGLNVEEVLKNLANFNFEDVDKNKFEDISNHFKSIIETQSNSLKQ